MSRKALLAAEESLLPIIPATKHRGNNENQRKNVKKRAKQIGLLVKKLPVEFHREIFDKLGPATRRILGATCASLYEVFKAHYFEKTIIVSFHEAAGVDGRLRFSNTPAYVDILASWLVPSLRKVDDTPRQRTWRLNYILVENRDDGSICLWYGGKAVLELSAQRIKEKKKVGARKVIMKEKGPGMESSREAEREEREGEEGDGEDEDIYEWEDCLT
ncbi:uncharacterized protein PAC_14381 [Phialocephala subalpina]|uniref:F-box domain-containing protein n=1 Tax=Phialocephala subalpina TaxID=576137 RepID=A0A1L7XHG0_9HELO|nr:uncharacterized protein PAC_14381 [Phialocephala subalpina]